MQVHQTQHAGAVQFTHHGVGQLGHLLVIHGQETVHRVLAAIGHGGVEAHLGQHTQLQQLLAHQARALDLGFQLFQVGRHLLQHLRLFAGVGEQRLAVGAECPGPGHVDADGKPVSVDACDAERVGAQHGGHVLRAPTFAGDVEVLVLHQAEDGDGRDGIGAVFFLAGLHEDDGKFTADVAEFGGSDKHRVQLVGHTPVGHRHLQLQLAMRDAVQRCRLAVQIGVDQVSSPGVSVRLTSTLSTRLPSRSTTSKRQPPHSTVSVVRGRRPSKSMIMPASVL